MILTIGNFDGIHLGHEQIFRKMRSLCVDKVSVLTFNPPSKAYFNSSIIPIYTAEEKLYHLKSLGVDEVKMLDFNQDLMKSSKEKFVEEIILSMKPKKLVIGSDFRFGYKAEGDVSWLRNYLKSRVEVIVIDVFANGSKFSSSLLRAFLMQGDLDGFHKHSGRRYQIRGELLLENNKLFLKRDLKLNVPDLDFEVSFVIDNSEERFKAFTEQGILFLKKEQEIYIQGDGVITFHSVIVI